MLVCQTIADFYKYIEFLTNSVENLLIHESNPAAKSVLNKLKLLLKSGAINDLIDGLSCRKVRISACNKVGEIGDALDELYIMRLTLPYPAEQFAIEQKKKENAQRTTLFILILGLFGFGWELD